MIKLLNRFAWVISIIAGLLFSLFVDRDGPFDDEGFFTFFIVLFICKFFILSRGLIEDRVEHFAVIISRINNTSTTISTIKETKKSEIFVKTKIEEAEVNKPNSDENFQKHTIPLKDNYDENKKDSKTVNYIKDFFSENILAKIGSILVFLGVLFLLSLIWVSIPGILKLIMGFIIGITVYLVGVKLDKKGTQNEARILLGTGILINYAVILSGRYILQSTNIDIIPEGQTEVYKNMLGVGTTFFFLILNTIFAVVTSLLYKSRVLLVFSIIFAYITPLLVGGDSSSPYVLVGYSIIVSLGAIFLAKKEEKISLIILSFLLGNFLIYIAPGLDAIHWITRFIAFNFLSIIVLLSAISFKKNDKNIIEILFAAIFVLIGIFNIFTPDFSLNSLTYYSIVMGSSALFMILAYINSKKWPFLYTIGTIGAALFMGSNISWDMQYTNINFIYIAIFATLNWLYPFTKFFSLKGKNNSIKHFILGSVSGVIFLGFEFFNFGKNLSHMEIGLGFFSLAIIYLIIGYTYINKVGIDNIKKEAGTKNTTYIFLAISTSLFSLAIAYIFSESHHVVSTIWLFEATILFYFYTKIKDIKVYLAGLLLFILGILNLYTLVNTISQGDYLFFIPFALIGTSLVLNLKILNNIKNGFIRYSHDIVHILGAMSLAFFIIQIVPHTGHGWSIISISIFSVIIAYIYAYFNSDILKVGYLIFIGLLMFYQIANLELTLNLIDISVEEKNNSHLRVLQYLTTIIIGMSLYVFNIISKNSTSKNISIVMFLMYLFVISTMYIYDMFSNTFAITMYWGIIAFILLNIGISKDIIKYRTIGLYLIVLMCLKIFFIDIFFGINDTIVRVIAFIAVGIMLIIISTMYSKKYGNNLKGEFKFNNLVSGKNNKHTNYKNNTEISTEKIIPKKIINQKISELDTKGISSANFKLNNQKTFSTKSQNLLKIIILIMNGAKSKKFKAGELNDIYKQVLKNYDSKLNTRDLNKVTSVIKEFVDIGGEVNLK